MFREHMLEHVDSAVANARSHARGAPMAAARTQPSAAVLGVVSPQALLRVQSAAGNDAAQHLVRQERSRRLLQRSSDGTTTQRPRRAFVQRFQVRLVLADDVAGARVADARFVGRPSRSTFIPGGPAQGETRHVRGIALEQDFLSKLIAGRPTIGQLAQKLGVEQSLHAVEAALKEQVQSLPRYHYQGISAGNMVLGQAFNKGRALVRQAKEELAQDPQSSSAQKKLAQGARWLYLGSIDMPQGFFAGATQQEQAQNALSYLRAHARMVAYAYDLQPADLEPAFTMLWRNGNLMSGDEVARVVVSEMMAAEVGARPEDASMFGHFSLGPPPQRQPPQLGPAPQSQPAQLGGGWGSSSHYLGQ